MKILKRDLLCDDSDLLRGVDRLATPEEVLVTHAVRVEVTSILVADSCVAVVTIATLGPRATVETLVAADVRSVSSGLGVGFPDIHLSAACSVSAVTSVGVSSRCGPIKNVGLE